MVIARLHNKNLYDVQHEHVQLTIGLFTYQPGTANLCHHVAVLKGYEWFNILKLFKAANVQTFICGKEDDEISILFTNSISLNKLCFQISI